MGVALQIIVNKYHWLLSERKTTFLVLIVFFLDNLSSKDVCEGKFYYNSSKDKNRTF